MAIKTFQKVETVTLDDTQANASSFELLLVAIIGIMFIIWGVGLVKEWFNKKILPFLVFGVVSLMISAGVFWTVAHYLSQSPEDYYKERRDNLISKGYTLVENGK